MRRIILIIVFGLLPASPFGWARELHYSNWSDNPRPYIDAIKKCEGQPFPTAPLGQNIRAGIVTHHFLANGLMVRFFEGLRSQSSPETIILLGPNHFHQGLADISLSSLPWKTPFGILPTDARLVQRISIAIQLPEDPEAFSGEHSVGILIPFLKYYFPRSKVVPILIDVSARDSRLDELRDVLSQVLKDKKVLVLLSMDFSHHSISSIADARDLKAKEVISSMDAKGARDLRVDSRKGLRLLLELLNQVGCDAVQFNEHTNSARLTGKLNQTDVTSYFTIYFLNDLAKRKSR
jgi:AmmeMemoRadiSam system protein B